MKQTIRIEYSIDMITGIIIGYCVDYFREEFN
jgi:hypothetical protein